MRKFAGLVASGVSVFGLVLMFQNCTMPASGGADEYEIAAKAMDFVYDTKLNQIAYMSCSRLTEGSYDSSAYFSIRAGAYDNNGVLGLSQDNGGVRLTDAFFQYVKSRPVDGKWGILSSSPANTGTIPQLAIRGVGSLQVPFTTDGSTAKQGVDYQNLLQDLGTTELSKSLVELPAGKRLKYMTNGTVWGARMEANLRFGASEDAANGLRTKLTSDQVVLGLTYTDVSGNNQSAVSARSIATIFEGRTESPNRDVYGRGYHLRFTKAANANQYHPTNQLYQVTEQDFHDLKDKSGTWNCNDLRFKIVLAQDADAQGCSRKPDPLVPTKLLKIARNSLKYEDWYIDMNNKCIVSKKADPSCYGDYKVIQYDITRECRPNPATNNAVTDSNKACVAFASLCYRTD